MDHLIRKVIFDAEYFQPGVAVYLETEETKQQGLIYTYSEDELTILKIRDVMTADNQMQVEPAQIQIHVSEVERNDIKIYRMHYSDHSIHCKWVDRLIAIILFWYFHYHYCQCYLGNQKTYLIQNTGKLLYESSKERRTFPWLKL